MSDHTVYEKIEDAAEAVYKQPSMPVQEKLLNFLATKNIQMYRHQADTYDAILRGENIILTTPTASGKTFASLLPLFAKLAENTDRTALLIYPTKALTRDQLLVVKELDKEFSTRAKPAIYDGDTRPELRSSIRAMSRIILTNMYELHHILPWRAKWADFFANLSFVFIDEAHKYRGVLGSNTALLIRRLRRICDFYDAKPQFILSSATLGNAEHFAEILTGLPTTEISKDGSPRSKRTFRIYNNTHKSSMTSAAELMSESINAGKQTICFTKSRAGAEITAIKCREEQMLGDISAYRGGYRPAERKIIEQKLKTGTVSGVVSTNALEVGIDIGSLDSVIINGFPGSMISVLQQAGRAGRCGNDAVITFVAGQNPIDQYYANNPNDFFNAKPEEAILGVENPYLLEAHLLCATAEIPYKSDRDRNYFGDTAEGLLEKLVESRKVTKTPRGFVYSGIGNPTHENTIFGSVGKTWSIIYGKTTLETMDDGQAYREAHPGAIIFHQGERYRVDSINETDSTIVVRKIEEELRTRPLFDTEIRINKKEKSVHYGNLLVHFGDVTVSTQIFGYSLLEYDQIVAREELHLPSKSFQTKACWITLDDDAPLTQDNLGGSIHGTEHALIAAMPIYVLSDRSDIGGVSNPCHPDTGVPTIFIYDGIAGGIGLAEKAQELFPKITKLAYKMVSGCKCRTGCPSCIHSPKCGNNNQMLDKAGTITLLNHFLHEMQK